MKTKNKVRESKANERTAEQHRDVVVRSHLAEFQALRDEILFRMRNADYSVVINVGVMGTILSLALPEQPHILLVVPFTSFLLGLMYFNQLRHVQMLGRYVQDVIAPAIREECHEDKVFQWETYHTSRKNEWTIVPKWGLINALAFVVPSFAAVIITLPSSLLSSNMILIKITWVFGLLLTLAFAYVWCREEKYISTREKSG